MLIKTTCISSILLFLVVDALAVDAKENADWPVYLGGKERNLYSILKQINRSNVSQLEIAWTFETGDKAEYQANNLIVDGLLYTPTPSRKVVALDAATGEARWTWDPAKDGPGKGRARQRGLVYWENEEGGERRLLTGVAGMLFALDPGYRQGDQGFWKGRVDQAWFGLEHTGRGLQGPRHRWWRWRQGGSAGL